MQAQTLAERILQLGLSNQILIEKSGSNYSVTFKDKRVESVGHIMCHFLYMKLLNGKRFYYHYHPREDQDSLCDLERIIKGININGGKMYNFYQANPYNVLTYDMGEKYKQERHAENEELRSLLEKFGIEIVNIPFINRCALDYSNELPEDTIEHADKFNIVAKDDIVSIVCVTSTVEIVIEHFNLSDVDRD